MVYLHEVTYIRHSISLAATQHSCKPKTTTMKKTVIAIWGNAIQGKSTSIREIASRIPARFPGSSVTYLIQGDVDIKAIAIINGLKVGIESQGDPNSRLRQSLDDFVAQGCEIIICATRTRGDTVDAVNELYSNHRYDIIWTSNLFSNEKDINYLNTTFANHILSVVADIINGVI